MDQDEVLLDRVLRPNPPLKPRALGVILSLVTAVNLAVALTFALRGAWPMAPFLGLDVALLAWAFRASLAAARREEHLTLTPSTLRLARRPEPREEVVLNPYWVRVELPERGPLTLWSHGRGIGVGSFLGPDEKQSLAHALGDALWRVRHR
ncbi:MAG: DUF2244 domain-containing protein [Alphaproteobacteria bacterium]|nr:DUF2244 domain-containing protein [Alphaproteobacteria bacterium]